MKPYKEKMPNVADIPRIPNWRQDTVPENWDGAPVYRLNVDTIPKDPIDIPIYPGKMPDPHKSKEDFSGFFKMDPTNNIWHYSDSDIRNAVKDKVLEIYDVNPDNIKITVDRSDHAVEWKIKQKTAAYVETVPLGTLKVGDYFTFPDTEVPPDLRKKIVPYKSIFKRIEDNKAVSQDEGKEYSIFPQIAPLEDDDARRIDYEIGILDSHLLIIPKRREGEENKSRAEVDHALNSAFNYFFTKYPKHKVEGEEYVIVGMEVFMKTLYEKGISTKAFVAISDSKGSGLTDKYIWFMSKDKHSMIVQKV